MVGVDQNWMPILDQFSMPIDKPLFKNQQRANQELL
jgi:hypothetical protein